jgi:hypothetical protein
LKKLQDFRLIVNGRTFNINFSLFCCVSDKFQEINRQEEEVSFSIPNQYLPCLISFLDIFKGLPFYFENYSFEALSYLIDLFGLSSLSEFINEHLPRPQNVQEAIDFLSIYSYEFHPKFFDNSFAILIHHFTELNFDQFLKLPNSILEKLFQSAQLQIDNEDILFQLIIQLIERDSNRKVLLKSIFFSGVSSNLLNSFFKNFPVEEVVSGLFESLKARLFCDVLRPRSLPLPSRWRNLSLFHSKEEIENIFKLYQNPFQQSTDSAELIQSLIKENEEMKHQLQEVKSESKEKDEQIFKLETTISNQSIQLQAKDEQISKLETTTSNQSIQPQEKNEQISKLETTIFNQSIQLQEKCEQNSKLETANSGQLTQLQKLKNEKEEIKFENVQLKSKNEDLTQSVQQTNEEIEKLLKSTQVNLFGFQGIINSLKQIDSNPVLITSSSNFHSDHMPENVLNPDDKF